MNKQRLEQKQYQNLSPQQIQFLGLLQIPIVSLEKRIEEELEENPALDEEEEQLEEIQNTHRNSLHKPSYQDLQIEDKSESLENYLVKQLIDLNLEDDAVFLVKYLINSLDDNGFLDRDLYSISSDLLANNNQKVSDNDLEIALQTLQGFEPVGVGTKGLQDCLLLQLKTKYPKEKIAFRICSEHYSSLSNKNFEFLIKHFNLTKNELKSVYRLIKSLRPIPAAGFSKNATSANYIYADFTITLNNNGIQVLLNKGNIKAIKVSKYYADLLLKTTDIKTKEFLTKKIDKAQWFKESIEKRDATLRRVMQAIVKLQRDYFTSGEDNDLIPMKLADVSEIVNMDISTISRVSNSKFIETHFGTFKVKELFSDAYRKDNGELISTNKIKKQLKEIIHNEDKLRPFTDEQISEILGKGEYHIARRTVAKYRENLSIETAKLRREL